MEVSDYKCCQMDLFSFHSIGLLMRRVFMMRTFSMVFQSSLLVVLEPSPLMKGETHTCLSQRLNVLVCYNNIHKLFVS